MCEVKKAYKDNVEVKKGLPYIRVKKTRFSDIEYFKDLAALDEVYPEPTFKEENSEVLGMLGLYKIALRLSPRMSPEDFLKNYLK